MLQSVERLQGWALLYEAVQNKSQLLSNLFNLREFSLAALHQTSSKGWRQCLELSSDLRLEETPELLLEADLRCECWALLGFSQEALSQPYASLRDASVQHRNWLGSGNASRTCKLCHQQWLHWGVPPPRCAALPPSRTGVSKPAIPHQHWGKLRKPLGVTGKTLKSLKTQRPQVYRTSDELDSLELLKLLKPLYNSLRNRRHQNISWEPHTKSQTRVVLGEHLEAQFWSPKMPEWHSVKFSSGFTPMMLKYLLDGSL